MINPKLYISQYYDSLVQEIDIFVEEKLNELNNFDVTKANLYYYKQNSIESLTIMLTEVKDTWNREREEMLAELKKGQQETIEWYEKMKMNINTKRNNFSVSQEHFCEEIETKLFSKRFYVLYRSKQKIYDIINRNVNSIFKLIQFDFYEPAIKRYFATNDYHQSKLSSILLMNSNKTSGSVLFINRDVVLQYFLDKKMFELRRDAENCIFRILKEEVKIDKLNVSDSNNQIVRIDLVSNPFPEIELDLLSNIEEIDIFLHLHSSLNEFKAQKSMKMLTIRAGYRRDYYNNYTKVIIKLDKMILNNMENIRKLHLDNCDFKELEKYAFASLVSLECLELINPLNCSHVELNSLSKLKKLQLDFKNNHDVPVFNLLFPFKDLEDFKFCYISREPFLYNLIDMFNSLKNCSNLQNLSLYCDLDMDKLDPVLLNGLFQLKSLEISSFKFPPNLTFDMLKCCTQNSGHQLIPTLERLKITYGNIESIDRTIFKYFSRLTYLDLSSNDLKDLDPEMFARMPNLIELDLSWNKIDVLQDGIFSALSNLTKLQLKYIKIKKLNSSMFRGLKSLKWLDISSSDSIKEIPLDVFSQTKMLETVDFTDNEKANNLRRDLEKRYPNIRFTFLYPVPEYGVDPYYN